MSFACVPYGRRLASCRLPRPLVCGLPARRAPSLGGPLALCTSLGLRPPSLCLQVHLGSPCPSRCFGRRGSFGRVHLSTFAAGVAGPSPFLAPRLHWRRHAYSLPVGRPPTGCGWSHLCAAAVRPCLVVALGRPPPTGCGGSPFGAVWVTLTLFPHLTLRQGHPLRDAVVPSFFTMRITLARSPLAFVFCTFTGPPPTGCGATPLLYHCFVFLGSVVSCTCSIYSFPRVLHC